MFLQMVDNICDQTVITLMNSTVSEFVFAPLESGPEVLHGPLDTAKVIASREEIRQDLIRGTQSAMRSSAAYAAGIDATNYFAKVDQQRSKSRSGNPAKRPSQAKPITHITGAQVQNSQTQKIGQEPNNHAQKIPTVQTVARVPERVSAQVAVRVPERMTQRRSSIADSRKCRR